MRLVFIETATTSQPSLPSSVNKMRDMKPLEEKIIKGKWKEIIREKPTSPLAFAVSRWHHLPYLFC